MAKTQKQINVLTNTSSNQCIKLGYTGNMINWQVLTLHISDK